MIFKTAFTFLLIVTASLQTAQAAEDAMLRDSNRCNRYFPQVEREYNVPANLLKAVSITESGYYHKESQKVIPWPWAVNSQGKGYYFKSKQEAIAAVRKMIKNGLSSIDVGCMQINLKFHPDAFANLEQAFDPRTNIAYAGKFLQNNFKRLHSWKGAVAAYHSETPQYGKPYAKKVLATWIKQDKDTTIYPNNQYAANQSFQLASERSLGAARSSLLSNSPRMSKLRRNSNIFIKVRQRQPDAAKMNVVQNVTQNALHKYQKSPDSLTILD